MRFLPNIRYGTENYPEKVARRLRAVNISAWIAAIFAIIGLGFSVARLFDGTPGIWKVAAINALGALFFASVPLLHRFGQRSAALTMMFVGYASLFILISLAGTGSGLSRFYLVTAALTVVFFGAEQIVLLALFGILAVLVTFVLE